MKIKSKIYGAYVRFQRLRWNLYNRKIDKSFGKSEPWGGFYLDPYDYTLLLSSFDAAKSIEIDLKTNPLYITAHLNFDALKKLNENNKYKDGNDLKSAIKTFDSKYKNKIKTTVNSPYRIVNIRAWEMLPTKNIFGPSQFHTDGFEPSHLKVMIYLSKLDSETGTIQFQGSPQLEKTEGYVLVFQNSDLIHAAIPGTKYGRKLIELTIQRLGGDFGLEPAIAFCNDRHFKKPNHAYKNL